jgi:hypothetical protein
VSSVSLAVDGIEGHVAGLEFLWDGGMEEAYAYYRALATPAVALAAAMVELALGLQEMGGQPPDPPRLLLGDLCLARASRLLAESRDQRLQIGFARAVERVSTAAAGGPPSAPLRTLLSAVIGEAA